MYVEKDKSKKNLDSSLSLAASVHTAPKKNSSEKNDPVRDLPLPTPPPTFPAGSSAPVVDWTAVSCAVGTVCPGNLCCHADLKTCGRSEYKGLMSLLLLLFFFAPFFSQYRSVFLENAPRGGRPNVCVAYLHNGEGALTEKSK